MATQKQMLGGWHSEPADANYCAKQLVKCVSPHHTLKRLIYGQTESGNISAVSHQQCLLLWSGRVFDWERTFINLYKACPFNHFKFFHIYLKKKGENGTLFFFLLLSQHVYTAKLHANFTDL